MCLIIRRARRAVKYVWQVVDLLQREVSRDLVVDYLLKQGLGGPLGHVGVRAGG
jgi:hypothetical protein